MSVTVTVLMPAYNCEKYIKEAIDSILKQSYKDFEFLIINDGSTDSTEEIILSYTDERIRYIKNDQNLRLIKTLNRGIELAHGKYIARMDSDDIAMPDRLLKQVRFLDKNMDFGVVGSSVEYFGDRLGMRRVKTTHEDIFAELFYECPMVHPSVMFRTDVIKVNNIRYQEEYPHSEDYKFWVDIIFYCKFANLKDILLKYRFSKEQVSNLHSKTQHKNSRVIRRYFLKKFIDKYQLNYILPEEFTIKDIKSLKEIKNYLVNEHIDFNLSKSVIGNIFLNLRLAAYLSLKEYSFISLVMFLFNLDIFRIKRKEVFRVIIKHFSPERWEKWI